MHAARPHSSQFPGICLAFNKLMYKAKVMIPKTFNQYSVCRVKQDHNVYILISETSLKIDIMVHVHGTVEK